MTTLESTDDLRFYVTVSTGGAMDLATPQQKVTALRALSLAVYEVANGPDMLAKLLSVADIIIEASGILTSEGEVFAVTVQRKLEPTEPPC